MQTEGDEKDGVNVGEYFIQNGGPEKHIKSWKKKFLRYSQRYKTNECQQRELITLLLK